MFAILAGNPTMLWPIDGTSSSGYLTLESNRARVSLAKVGTIMEMDLIAIMDNGPYRDNL